MIGHCAPMLIAILFQLFLDNWIDEFVELVVVGTSEDNMHGNVLLLVCQEVTESLVLHHNGEHLQGPVADSRLVGEFLQKVVNFILQFIESVSMLFLL